MLTEVIENIRGYSPEDRERWTKTNWWIITGGPSTGKSTLLSNLQQLGYKTVPEAARVAIDEGIERGQTVEEIRADEFYFQSQVHFRKARLEHTLPEHQLIFWDRGLDGDTSVYAIKAMLDDKANPDPDEIYGTEIISAPTKLYKGVFLLDRLPYQKDYARVEDEEEAAGIHNALDKAYRKFGYNPIRVPVLPIDERIEFILDQARKIDPSFPPPPQFTLWRKPV